MPSVIFFTDISKPEIAFLNEVYGHLAQKGITLRAVVFKDYQGCIKKLKCDYIYLKTFNLFNLNLPHKKKRDINIYNDDFLKRLILLEKEINRNCKINVSDYEYRLDNLISFVENLTSSASAYFVMSRSYTAYEVVKSVLVNKKISFILFEKWTFAESYQFSTHGIQLPKLDSNLIVDNEHQYRLLLQKLFSDYKGRHKTDEKAESLPDKYVLLLLSDGCGGSYCLKNVEEYWTNGKGWGNDFEVTTKIEKCVQKVLPDSKLLVRQHPYTKYRLEKQHINPRITRLVNKVELDLLVSKADIIMTAPGSISYYALAKGKKPIILGNGELCGTEVVRCIGSEDELYDYISEISDNKDALYINREKVIEAAMPFFINQVWVNDETFTYRVLTKYIENKTMFQEDSIAWQTEKRRICKYQACINIKITIWNLARRIKTKLTKLFVGNATARQKGKY